MKHTKKLVFMALLTAVSLGIWIAESQIPAIVPVPGVKLGLANIITLSAMALLGKREAGCVLLLRIVLGSVFAGSFSAILFSLAGGTLAFAVMAMTIGIFPENKLWVVSVLAAVAHNAGQLIAAVLVTKTPSLWWYGAPLLAAGILTGAFTGVAAVYLVKAVKPFINRA